MVVEILVPLGFFLVVFGVTFVIVLFRHRNRKAGQETLRAAIEQGQTLDRETVQSLTGYAPPSGDQDLRRGLILLAIALATVGFGWLLNEPETSRVFYGSALFPGLVGLAYIAMTRFSSRTV